MATPKLNPSRSIAVIPSDYCNIPNPALFITECIVGYTNTGTFNVIGTNLIEKGVKVGDIVYDYTSGVAATITSIQYSYNPLLDPSEVNTIVFNGPVDFSEESIVQIYSGSDDSTGCVLYIGSGGDMKATTEGGDEVTFVNLPSGSFLPVQVVKVGTLEVNLAKDILALR